MAPESSDIILYTDTTANGLKISICLEELGLPYKVEHLNIMTGVQKEPWFLEINPNGRIPAITDKFSDGQKIRLFESGGILQYLIDEYDKDYKISFPKGTREYYEMINWTFFQNAGLGPMQGQANHFVRYAPTTIPYAVDRYLTETRRLYSVLNARLENSKSGFLVGDHISVADITTIGWVIWAFFAGIEAGEFPAVEKWERMMSARDAVKRGCDVPKPLRRINNKADLDEYLERQHRFISGGKLKVTEDED